MRITVSVYRRTRALLLVAVMASASGALLQGCGADLETRGQPPAVEPAQLAHPDLVLHTASDGQSLESLELADGRHLEGDMVSRTLEDLGRDPESFSYQSRPGGPYIRVGDYGFRPSFERGYIGGCVGRHNTLHLGFMINNARTGLQVINIHVAMWRENGRPCIAVYESVSTRCARICGPSRNDIKNAMVPILATVMTATAAAALAEALSSVAAGALVLAL